MPRKGSPTPGGDELDTAVERLVKLAPPAREVPEAIFCAAREEARSAWRRTQAPSPRAARRRPGWFGGLALAAGVLLAAGLIFVLGPRLERELVGEPARLVAWFGEGEGGSSWEARTGDGRIVAIGTALETAPRGRAAIRLASGASLRLDHATSITLSAPAAIDLEGGAIYVDGGKKGSSVLVTTPFGTIREIGTQFEVRIVEDGLRIQVREGAVQLDDAAGQELVEAGGSLEIDAAGQRTREVIEPYGDLWSWVIASMPPFDPEGKSVATVLEWTARESGFELRYEDTDTRAQARAAIVRGELLGLAPRAMLEVVLPGAGLEHRMADGVLLVRAR